MDNSENEGKFGRLDYVSLVASKLTFANAPKRDACDLKDVQKDAWF